MKILLLASRVPYPLDNGEDLRVFHFAKYLSPQHDIHLLAYTSGSPPAPEVARYFSRIHTIETQPSNGSNGRLISRLAYTFSPDHMYSFDTRISSALNHLLEQDQFDLIWIPAWPMIPYAKYIKDVPVFLDVMDDGILELARELRFSGSMKEAGLNFKRLFVTFLFERKYFSRVSLCSLVSERDAEVLRWVCPSARQVVIPNGVDSDYFKPLGLDEKFPSIVFEGNMGFPPSVDAVLHFCREIFPLVVEKIPEVKFYIVGKNPASEIQALASEHIIVTGYVEDVRPFLDQSSIFICPMRKGAGIKNKILQAWAMMKPVLATKTALGGLCATDEENILIADEPRSFAEAVIRLLEDPALRHSLGLSGRETVLRHHTWQHQVQLLEDQMKDL
jgi:sugar transferase (PEP-CTERM/EpsH1 system associated)